MEDYSENALAIYKRLYYNPDETTPEQVHERVGRAIGNSEIQKHAFITMMNDKIFRPNTPCLINAKSEKSKSDDKPYDNNLAACYVLGLDDSMESIIKMWMICARVYAGGGGCGIPLSNLREKGAAISTGGQACLTGDTILYNDNPQLAAHRQEYTINELYNLQVCHGKTLSKIRCMIDNGTLGTNAIEEVIYNGIADVYQITTELGYTIKATPNHRFLGYDGQWHRVDEFYINDMIAVNGTRQMGVCPRCGKQKLLMGPLSQYHGYCQSCAQALSHGRKKLEKQPIGKCIRCGKIAKLTSKNAINPGLCPGCNTSVRLGCSLSGSSEHLEKMQKVLDNMHAYMRTDKMRQYMHDINLGEKNPNWKGNLASETTARQRLNAIPELKEIHKCQRCGKSDLKLERHHKDGNPYNNELNNIEVLCIDCHHIEHTLRKQLLSGDPRKIKQIMFDRITDITYAGKEEVFDIRMKAPYHNFIANGFVSHNSGPISYLKVVQSISDSVRSGGKTRRAANLTSFKYNHPDILDYIECKQHADLSAINISVLVSDEFMQAIENQEYDKEYDLISPTGKIVRRITIGEVWTKICQQAWKSGDPGLLFYNEANRRHAFPSKGEILATNPCLPSWAPVLTPNGYTFFSNLQKSVLIYNNVCDCSELIKTKDRGRVYEVKLECGLISYMTLNHKVAINPTTDKPLEELKPGDLVYIDNSNILDQNKKFNEDQFELAINDWKERKTNNCIVNALNKDFSYQFGLILAAILTRNIYIDKTSQLIVKDFNNDLGLHLLQLYLLQFGIFSEFKSHKLFIKSIIQFKKILNDINRPELIRKLRLTEIESSDSNSFESYRYQKITNITYHSTVPVYDIQVPSTNHFVTSGLVVHNCGEVTLPDFSMCNLGSLNLVQFLTENNKFDHKKFVKYIHLAVEFLDRVIDKTSYPTIEFSERMKSERPIGLGIMGLSWLFFKMGIRYGSDESIELFEEICKTLTSEAFRHSITLAKKLGPIQIPDKDVYYFIDRLRYFGLIDDDIYKFNEYGIRNSTVTSIAPTGCLDTNTYLLTSNGLLKLAEINPYDGNPENNPKSWHKHDIKILQENCVAKSDQFYINSITQNTRIITKHGYELCGSSETHRIRVIDINGKYIWKFLKDITPDDLIPIKLGGHNTLLNNLPYVKLNKLANIHHANSDLVDFIQPDELTEELAYIIGYFMGDGNSSQFGIRFTIPKNEPEIEELITIYMSSIFGLYQYVEDQQDCYIYEYPFRDLKRFFEINGWLKIHTCKEQKENYIPFIPLNVRQSNTSVMGSFLRGLFDANASIYRQQSSIVFKFSSKFKSFIQEVQTALLTFGIPTHLYQDNSISEKFKNNPVYSLRPLSVEYLNEYNTYIGFTSNEKQDLLLESINSNTYGIGTHFKHVKLWTDFYNQYKSETYKNIKYKVLKTHQSNLLSAKKICFEQEDLLETTLIGWLIKNDLILEPIKEIKNETGLTVDISVPEKNTYISNGFVSHNSVSISADTSYAFEPEMALIWSKKLVDSGQVLYFTNQIFEEACKSAGVELTDEIKNKIAQNKGSCQGIDEIPQEIQNVFVTAFDVGWEKKIKMQEVGQRWISLAISSTCNLPNEATIKDVEKAYLMAWKCKLKGITVYRDGSIFDQPVNFGGTEQKKEEPAPQKIEGEVTVHINQKCPKIQRPMVRVGKTIEIKTPHGTLYVTGNVDENGKLIEVFLNLGQQGHVTNILLNALGRVISKYLQFGLPLDEICETLSNSGGLGFFAKLTTDGRSQQVDSIVDAISKILETHFNQNETNYFKNLDDIIYTKDIPQLGEKCPQCGEMTLVHSSGCRGGSCPSCGYSACQ